MIFSGAGEKQGGFQPFRSCNEEEAGRGWNVPECHRHCQHTAVSSCGSHAEETGASNTGAELRSTEAGAAPSSPRQVPCSCTVLGVLPAAHTGVVLSNSRVCQAGLPSHAHARLEAELESEVTSYCSCAGKVLVSSPKASPREHRKTGDSKHPIMERKRHESGEKVLFRQLRL